MDKFVRSVQPFTNTSDEVTEEFYKVTRRLVWAGIRYENKRKKQRDYFFWLLFGFLLNLGYFRNEYEEAYEWIYTETIRWYNSFCAIRDKRFNHLDLFDFYLPDISDRDRATKLVEEAIELITGDKTISRVAVRRIVTHLNEALNELRRPKPNWPTFFGKIKEVIIVMGAIGSITGGACAINTARDKLNEATQVIEKTSINVNYMALVNNQLTDKSVKINLLPEGRTEK
jgi:hypothetical protein